MKLKSLASRRTFVAVHFFLGALLVFITPLLFCLMKPEQASVYSFHHFTPLIPFFGLGWMLLGALLIVGKPKIDQIARAIYIAWLCLIGCLAALGVVLICVAALSANRKPFFGEGTIGQFGVYLVFLGAVLFGISIGLLFLLRHLRSAGPSAAPPSTKTRFVYSLGAGALSILVAMLGLAWQVSIDQQRSSQLQQTHEQQLQGYAYDGGQVKSLVFSPDDNYLATAIEFDYSHRGVRIWDVQSGRLLQEMDGGREVLSLTFTPDSASLIVCYEDQWNSGGFTVFNREKGTEEFRNSDHRISSVAVSADGKVLVACGNAGYGNNSLVAPFTVWNLATFTKVFESPPKYGYISAAFSASQTRLAVRRQEAIEIWPIPMDANSTFIRSWDPRMGGDDVTAVAFCGDDTKVAAGGVFGSKVWSLSDSNGDPDDASDLPTVGPTNAGTFSDDGSLLVVANQEQLVQVIDLETETLSHEFKAPFWVEGLAISSDNKLIAVGGQGRVVMLDANSGALIKELAQRDRL
ncbi:WD domain, G-beta repeat [Rubripirellula tenax]|uniref:WD domain, G-beta repeat n=1 Tax=Rubripirellula tenax TaxID=2528015 RepID=A0A5C6F2A2_9BACT|nr:WD40 repeat domain-containing protein [Rubripirellula tenax]TWU54744.1 WD domain, G-beta repeat [Rubripirellula tenax]